MPEEYTALVAALKSLDIPFAENGWTSRPKVNTYGIVAMDFEADALRGDNHKLITAYSGSVDLFSYDRGGDDMPEAIAEILETCCEGAWSLNSHTWEPSTRLFHWEWTFETEG
ncbi:MAG: hypothetical protein J6T08_11140 [Lentisphaeria bacterium]|nr:hypothetical protein [Lentisphaeria bacterium]